MCVRKRERIFDEAGRKEGGRERGDRGRKEKEIVETSGTMK